jgi:hypothetical protein
MRRSSPTAARLPAAILLAATASLAACQPVSLAPLPSLAGLLESPSASAGGGATPGESPSASASAAPGAADALAVLDGLRAFADDPAQTYRVSFTGDSRHTTAILKVKGTLDVSGDDAAIGATFRVPGKGGGRTDYRLVNGTDWMRFDKGAWRGLKEPPPDVVLDPFAGLHDGSRVQYLGPVDGEDGHYQVQLAGMYLHPALIPARNLTREKVTATKLLLVTEADGTPVRGTWTMRGRGRVSGQLQAIVIELDLTFSKIGEPLTIRKP